MKRFVVLIIVMSSLLGASKMEAQVGVSITVAPPALPVYAQPECPGDGYMWSPGYWAWGPDGYYWVPGVWVLAPEAGFLWTPGYWGFVNGGYFWHGGYWGPHVGFYGGVCYGFGYGGRGFYGGRWEGGHFMYNSAAWHVGGGIHNTYVDRTVIVNNNNRTSFNGRGGIEAQPNASEQAAMNEHHVQATSAQVSHQHTASMNRNQLASHNGGHPSAMARSTVGGQRFSSSGTAIHSPAAHPAAAPQHAAPAMQHAAPQMSHSAPAQHAAPAMQHSAPPMQHSAPQSHGGAPRGGGGGGGHRR